MTEYIFRDVHYGYTDGTALGCTLEKQEEIVRCGDCKHYVEDPEPIDPGWPMMCEDTGRDMVEPYGFCAWALRKEVGE